MEWLDKLCSRTHFLQLAYQYSKISSSYPTGPDMKKASRRDSLAASITFIRTVPLFAHLSDAELGRLAEDFSPFEYSKNDVLFWQGDTSSELYLIRRGKVRIYKISPGGRETSINIFSTGDILGEFAAIDQH